MTACGPPRHRDARSARPTGRAERQDWLYLAAASRRPAGAPAARLLRGGVGTGCRARRMQRESHYGLIRAGARRDAPPGPSTRKSRGYGLVRLARRAARVGGDGRDRREIVVDGPEVVVGH